MSSFHLAVAGIMGSGKTTLARSLANELHLTYVPEFLNGKKYLPFLFENPKKWAFETQLSFFTEKSLQIINKLKSGQSIIVDRTLLEDYLIFAQFFFDNGYIEKKAFMTYVQLAKHFLNEIQKPDLIIYCRCSLNIVKERISNRGREYQKNYPKNYLTDIFNRYNSWIEDFKESALYLIDSEASDFRNQKVITTIKNEIQNILRPKGGFVQLELFSSNINKTNKNIVNEVNEPFLLEKLIHKTNQTNHKYLSSKIKKKLKIPPYPYAYIAAPFTSVSSNLHRKRVQKKLIEMEQSHGIIPDGLYKEMLKSLTKKLKKIGLNSLLPHRDINEWGKKILTPNDVVNNCSDQVSMCDIFIGLIGSSLGSHYEFGLAFGLKKPSVIIKCDELNNSFICSGITNRLPNVQVFSYNKIEEILDIVNEKQFLGFLMKHVPISVN